MAGYARAVTRLKGQCDTKSDQLYHFAAFSTTMTKFNLCGVAVTSHCAQFEHALATVEQRYMTKEESAHTSHHIQTDLVLSKP